MTPDIKLNTKGRRWTTFGPEALVLAAIVIYALLGRGRWANVTEDHGFWFSAVQSLLSGGRAMHEVRLQFGPVSLWVLEAASRIFGTRVSTIVYTQLAIGAAAIIAVQFFARRILVGTERWICAAILATLIVWMVGPGSLLYPCAFAMSQGLFFAMACLLIQDAALRRSSGVGAFLAGIVAAVAFLTKQEFGVVAVLGILALTIFFRAFKAKQKVWMLTLSGVAFLAAYFGVLLGASRGDTLAPLVRANILWPWAPIPAPWKELYRGSLGFRDFPNHLLEASDAAIAILAFGGTAWLVLYRARLPRRLAAAGAGLVLGFWAVWGWRWTEGLHFMPMTLTLPAVVASGLLVVVSRASRNGKTPGRAAGTPLSPGQRAPELGSFLALWLSALVLLQREGYRGTIDAYYSGMGYVLAVPLLAFVIGWIVRGPTGSGSRTQRVAFAILFLELATFGRDRLHILEVGWRSTERFDFPRGAVYVDRGFAPRFGAVVRFLEDHSKPKDPILVLPQTFGLDFLLNRRNLSFFPYVSPGYLTPDGERELIARCESSPPRAVVVFHGLFGSLHAGDFRRGFAAGLTAWLDEHYSSEPLTASTGRVSVEGLLPRSAAGFP